MLGNIAQWGGWVQQRDVGRKADPRGSAERFSGRHATPPAIRVRSPAAGGARRAMREPWPAANRQPATWRWPSLGGRTSGTRQGTARGTSTRTGRGVVGEAAQPAKSRQSPSRRRVIVPAPGRSPHLPPGSPRQCRVPGADARPRHTAPRPVPWPRRVPARRPSRAPLGARPHRRQRALLLIEQSSSWPLATRLAVSWPRASSSCGR